MVPAPHASLQQAPGRPAPGTSPPVWQRPRQPLLRLWPTHHAADVARAPAEARLRWADGKTSAGTVHTTAAGTWFTVDSADPVLAKRCSRGTDAARGAGPGTPTLAVVPAECGGDVFVPRLPGLPVVASAPQAPGW